MTSKVLEFDDIIHEDKLATNIADSFTEWDMYRQIKKTDWEELRRYVYATNTTQTSNSSLPWKNKTTVPKLCQIRDNLQTNYPIAIVPQRKSVSWQAMEKDSASRDKRDAIENYMTWVMGQPSFRNSMDKLILDYIDYGNAFVTVEWTDERADQKELGTQMGYVGPSLKRISPLDIVFNPTAESFENSPKIIRSLVSMGEVKMMLERLSNDENKEQYDELWKYMREIRGAAHEYMGDFGTQNRLYQIEGFTSFTNYLASDTVELLTFYGDIYDYENDVFLKNHVITVVDRHKIIAKKPNPSYFGYPPIYHVAWRVRPDNLWGMGPLDNLVGMQYRLDHVENMKADIYDLVTYPVQKITGFVEDFTWRPGEKIYVSEEGNVELICPDVNALQANFEIDKLEKTMEEMAGAPREALGIRTPGEKTKFEVQTLDNAGSRVFTHKSYQFNEQLFEKALNACLELGRRNMANSTQVQVFDDDLKVVSFQTLAPEDITGIGRIKPVASRHFAEQAELVQNLTSITNSPMWATIQPHFSSVSLAKMFEKIFKLEDYEIVLPYVALSEQAEAQKISQSLEEHVQQQTMTASGMGEDFDAEGMLPPGEPMPEEIPVQ